MSIYDDKGLEQLRAKLEVFEENYKKRLGQTLDRADFLKRLEEKLEKRRHELFESTFGTLTPNDLFTLIKMVKDPEPEPLPEFEEQEMIPEFEPPKKLGRQKKSKAGNE